MLLAVDIGNTSINNGIFQGKKLKKKFRVRTYTKYLKREYEKYLRPYLSKIDSVVISSVVPVVLDRLEKIIKALVRKEIFIVGENINTGIKNRYKYPEQVGPDRLVNAKAAYELYGKKDAIVIDFGTAITIDIVNKNKEYLGGVIAPGIEISLEALSEKAYLLPTVRLSKPKSILGRETGESMIIGAVYGFSSLSDGLVRKLKKRYCKKAVVIATGGFSQLVAPYCETVDKIDPDLTLKGLSLIRTSPD